MIMQDFKRIEPNEPSAFQQFVALVKFLAVIALVFTLGYLLT